LLQILDEGRLTDGQGRVVNFRNTIIVMTSNVGSEVIAELNDKNEIQRRIQEAFKHNFRPEFLNRIDENIIFNRLKQEDIQKIVSELENSGKTSYMSDIYNKAQEYGYTKRQAKNTISGLKRNGHLKITGGEGEFQYHISSETEDDIKSKKTNKLSKRSKDVMKAIESLEDRGEETSLDNISAESGYEKQKIYSTLYSLEGYDFIKSTGKRKEKGA